MKTKTRQGFTLVELLVVIAIIGILVALLLPAVQAAREAARRMQCGNNLHQLGIGFHNYHDTFKTLPPALVWWNNGVAPHTADNACWAWGTLILPWVEQQPLHDLLAPGNRSLVQAATNPTTLAAMQQPIGYYKCPSDVGPKLNNSDASAMINGTIPVALSNYVVSSTSRAYAHRNGNNGAADTTTRAEARARVVHAGAFVEGVGINFAGILDGTANVIAAGERRWQFKSIPPGGAGTGSIRIAGAANVFGVRDRTTDARKRRVMGRAQWVINYKHEASNGRADQGFSSQHPGGAQFVFCDGSVHFIPETVDTGPRGTGNNIGVLLGPNQPDSTWERLCARADGDPVQLP